MSVRELNMIAMSLLHFLTCCEMCMNKCKFKMLWHTHIHQVVYTELNSQLIHSLFLKQLPANQLTEKIPVQNTKFQHCHHKSKSLDPAMSQFTIHFSKIHF